MPRDRLWVVVLVDGGEKTGKFLTLLPSTGSQKKHAQGIGLFCVGGSLLCFGLCWPQEPSL